MSVCICLSLNFWTDGREGERKRKRKRQEERREAKITYLCCTCGIFCERSCFIDHNSKKSHSYICSFSLYFFFSLFFLFSAIPTQIDKWSTSKHVSITWKMSLSVILAYTCGTSLIHVRSFGKLGVCKWESALSQNEFELREVLMRFTRGISTCVRVWV